MFLIKSNKNILNNNLIKPLIRCYSTNTTTNNESLNRMKNKVCFVTGGASGIGLGIVEKFVKEGGKVAIADLDKGKADVESSRLNKLYPGSTISVGVDVADEQQVQKGIQDTVGSFGGLDVVVSNAGLQHIESIETLDYSVWRKMMGVHLDGAFLCTKHAMQEFKKDVKRGGTILYMGSVHSKYASEYKIPYVTAKHGLEGLCRGIAREGAKYNIRANLICPGFVLTPLVQKQIPDLARKFNMSEESVAKDILLKHTVDGEFTTVEDVAEVAVNFSAIPNKCLTGQSLLVSHGWIME
ncbi:hypothetical protein DICPUDRAFT_91189 [Dictyostelium purpureum]|uniref:3-oxoacyl-[acyl-carrier-protein] reductase n=1 Tax=Dictyostelium purpureum TaxID=5786 RepID=F0Z8T3_DICPU|nr:uncharacterized protein DICPUDRAFT_91189 [Dictyostelium purpureum]EGC39602.1 hypothetical protein DICPUDRAFT_91189 [Dictyostelium purpureum]|eukprot:XP_003283823.1 hypothetical protein DICPUDRAFT_91189 [Dictyostelium purpureum]